MSKPVGRCRRETSEGKAQVMDYTREQCLNRLLDVYSHRYDIERNVSVGTETYDAAATYYLRDENYLISKQHVLSAVESHEYVYFYCTDRLKASDLQHQIDLTKEDGLGKIHPNKTHMCSFVTLIILADEMDPEAVQLIEKTRFRKNFMLTLHGWMEYRIAAMELSTTRFFSNPAGKEARKNLEQNFTPQNKKKKGVFKIL